MRLSIFIFLLPTAIVLSACTVSTTDSKALYSTVRSTKMGPSQYMVTCVDSSMYCAEEATKLCPQGFDVTSNVTNPADFGRMTMTIKCPMKKK